MTPEERTARAKNASATAAKKQTATREAGREGARRPCEESFPLRPLPRENDEKKRDEFERIDPAARFRIRSCFLHQGEEAIMAIDHTWNVDFAKNACQFRENSANPCLSAPTTDVKDFERRLVAFFASELACKNVVVIGPEGRTARRGADVEFHLIGGGHQMPSDGGRIVSRGCGEFWHPKNRSGQQSGELR